jgi:hypothetical protein
MLTTVAVLIVVLGLMVSLAHYVRNAMAVEMTKDLLHRMDAMMQQYMSRHGETVPAIAPFLPADLPPGRLPDEQTLRRAAEENNRSFVALLRSGGQLANESFGGLPQSVFNDAMLRDAWGSPIVFMPSMHPGIGMAPQDKPFFFSAGPDARYLTQENNLYSYER